MSVTPEQSDPTSIANAYLSGVSSQPQSRPSGGGGLDVPGVVDDELEKLGYPEQTRLAILGNVGRENSWNPNIIFGGHVDPASYKNGRGRIDNRGIISWNGDRKGQLDRWMGDWTPSEDNLRKQVGFMHHELQTRYPGVYNTITDPDAPISKVSRSLRDYIGYSTSPEYNTPDGEYDVAANRKWAIKAQERGLAQFSPTRLADSYLSQTDPDPQSIADSYLNSASPAQLQPTTPQPVPETPQTIAAQQQAAADPDSTRAGVYFPPNQQAPDLAANEVAIPVKDGGVIHADAASVHKLLQSDPDAIRRAVLNGDFNALIGGKAQDLGNDTANKPAVVTRDANGNELVASAVTDPNAIPQEAAMQQAQFPNQPTTTHLSTTDDIAADRLATNAPPDNDMGDVRPSAMPTRDQLEEQAYKSWLGEADDTPETRKEYALSKGIHDLSSISSAAKAGTTPGDEYQVDEQYRRWREQRGLPATKETVDQFNADMRQQQAAQQARSQADFLNENPGYAAYLKAHTDQQFGQDSLDKFQQESYEKNQAAMPRQATAASSAVSPTGQQPPPAQPDEAIPTDQGAVPDSFKRTITIGDKPAEQSNAEYVIQQLVPQIAEKTGLEPIDIEHQLRDAGFKNTYGTKIEDLKKGNTWTFEATPEFIDAVTQRAQAKRQALGEMVASGQDINADETGKQLGIDPQEIKDVLAGKYPEYAPQLQQRVTAKQQHADALKQNLDGGLDPYAAQVKAESQVGWRQGDPDKEIEAYYQWLSESGAGDAKYRDEHSEDLDQQREGILSQYGSFANMMKERGQVEKYYADKPFLKIASTVPFLLGNEQLSKDRATLRNFDVKNRLSNEEYDNATNFGNGLKAYLGSKDAVSNTLNSVGAGAFTGLAGDAANLGAGVLRIASPMIDWATGGKASAWLDRAAEQTAIVGQKAGEDNLSFDVGQGVGQLPGIIGATALAGGNPIIGFGLHSLLTNTGKPVEQQTTEVAKNLVVGGVFEGAPIIDELTGPVFKTLTGKLGLAADSTADKVIQTLLQRGTRMATVGGVTAGQTLAEGGTPEQAKRSFWNMALMDLGMSAFGHQPTGDELQKLDHKILTMPDEDGKPVQVLITKNDSGGVDVTNVTGDVPNEVQQAVVAPKRVLSKTPETLQPIETTETSGQVADEGTQAKDSARKDKTATVASPSATAAEVQNDAIAAETAPEKPTVKTNSTAEPKDQEENVPGSVHTFSSTQANLPKEQAAKVLDVGRKLIPDSEIYTDPKDPSYGREENPHVTVKYGIHSDKADDVEKALATEKPFTAKLGKISIFEGKGDTPYDVIKADVESPELHKLNKVVAGSTKVTDTFPTYEPHVTLAYVKKGEGEKYVGRTDLEGTEIPINSVQFSGKNGEEVDIPLGGKPKSSTTPVKPESSAKSAKDTENEPVVKNRYVVDAPRTKMEGGVFEPPVVPKSEFEKKSRADKEAEIKASSAETSELPKQSYIGGLGPLEVGERKGSNVEVTDEGGTKHLVPERAVRLGAEDTSLEKEREDIDAQLEALKPKLRRSRHGSENSDKLIAQEKDLRNRRGANVARSQEIRGELGNFSDLQDYADKYSKGKIGSNAEEGTSAPESTELPKEVAPEPSKPEFKAADIPYITDKAMLKRQVGVEFEAPDGRQITKQMTVEERQKQIQSREDALKKLVDCVNGG